MSYRTKFDFMNTERLTIDKLNDDGCINLLEAFLVYMSDTYRSALSTFLADKNDKKGYESYKSIRDFFLSDYFTQLTNLKGEDILSRLDKSYLDSIVGGI